MSYWNWHRWAHSGICTHTDKYTHSCSHPVHTCIHWHRWAHTSICTHTDRHTHIHVHTQSMHMNTSIHMEQVKGLTIHYACIVYAHTHQHNSLTADVYSYIYISHVATHDQLPWRCSIHTQLVQYINCLVFICVPDNIPLRCFCKPPWITLRLRNNTQCKWQMSCELHYSVVQTQSS